ncbi:hypothetical protein W823_03105 [Williamsia sp. D3]|nr:hypothetical protein W823_03105 [Williamsia sp. D3]
MGPTQPTLVAADASPIPTISAIETAAALALAHRINLAIFFI